MKNKSFWEKTSNVSGLIIIILVINQIFFFKRLHQNFLLIYLFEAFTLFVFLVSEFFKFKYRKQH
jgi:hypothetical protein